jgi:hypothetical protein
LTTSSVLLVGKYGNFKTRIPNQQCNRKITNKDYYIELSSFEIIHYCLLPSATILYRYSSCVCRSHWPRGLRRRSTAARLLRSWILFPPGASMFVCCVWCVLSGIGLCDELTTRPEESYRLRRVVVCDQEISWTRRP